MHLILTSHQSAHFTPGYLGYQEVFKQSLREISALPMSIIVQLIVSKKLFESTSHNQKSLTLDLSIIFYVIFITHLSKYVETHVGIWQHKKSRVTLGYIKLCIVQEQLTDGIVECAETGIYTMIIKINLSR